MTDETDDNDGNVLEFRIPEKDEEGGYNAGEVEDLIATIMMHDRWILYGYNDDGVTTFVCSETDTVMQLGMAKTIEQTILFTGEDWDGGEEDT